MLLSLAIIISHVWLIYLIRLQLNKCITSCAIKDLLFDGLFAFELGCLVQEQGVVLQYYGLFPWACCLFSVVVWQVVAWPGRSSSPIEHILKFSVWGFITTAVMLTCSLVSYRYISMIWEVEMCELHRGRGKHNSIDHCAFPFKETSTLTLLLTEYIGSLVLSMVSVQIFNHPGLVNNDPKRYIRGCLMGCAVVLAVVLGMDVSGAMYNPTLATLLLGGCAGQTTSEHILVYWVAPVGGVWTADKYQIWLENKKARLAKLKAS